MPKKHWTYFLYKSCIPLQHWCSISKWHAELWGGGGHCWPQWPTDWWILPVQVGGWADHLKCQKTGYPSSHIQIRYVELIKRLFLFSSSKTTYQYLFHFIKYLVSLINNTRITQCLFTDFSWEWKCFISCCVCSVLLVSACSNKTTTVN